VDRGAALADIDRVLAAAPTGDGGGTTAVAEMAALRYACICRWTTSGNAYRLQADRFHAMSTSTVTGERTKAEIALLGVLRALRQDVDADQLRSIEELVHADLFADLLAQASYLNDTKFSRAAAVLAGGVLEEHLRQLCAKNTIATIGSDGKPRKASALNADLYSQRNIYSNAERAEIEGWQNRRNAAAHGEADFETKHDQADIRRMVEGVRSLIVKYPA
jgi:hypothetical protein